MTHSCRAALSVSRLTYERNAARTNIHHVGFSANQHPLHMHLFMYLSGARLHVQSVSFLLHPNLLKSEFDNITYGHTVCESVRAQQVIN